jgi:hypothetical protein
MGIRLQSRIALLAVVVGGGACGTTKFKSTWMDPAAPPGELQGKRVAAIAVPAEESRRKGAEDRLVMELAKQGVQAVPGYQLMKTQAPKDPAALVSLLRQQNVEGAVVMREVQRRERSNYLPAYVPGGPSIIPGSERIDGWGSIFGPGYVDTDLTVAVETVIYSVPEGKPLWRGVSETFDPVQADAVVKNTADDATRALTRAGLIGR